jgi:hypothetical protein
MEETVSHSDIEVRVEKLESEMRALRKFVTTLETGHESRARGWNSKIGVLTKEIGELKVRVQKTRKRVKKLAR